ncbi:MAG: hypothetical protein KDC10_03385 [Calditrichaeota bacterium]|nr:hypothetical protein [Calditrichota bacterium]
MNGRALLNCAAILGLALLLVSCGENRGDEDQTAPDAPVMRLTACSFEGPVWPESGVDAEPGSTGIRVEWQLWPRPEDLAGFVVFRGHQENADTVGVFFDITGDPAQFLVGAPEYFSFIDTGQNLNLFTSPDIHGNLHTWHYFVRALDTSGNLSAASDTVHYTLYDAPLVQEATLWADSLRVRWSYGRPGPRLAGYQLMMLDENDEMVWSADMQEDFDLQNFDLSWNVASLGTVAGRSFRLRVDTLYERPPASEDIRSNPDNCPLAGSESGWIELQP